MVPVSAVLFGVSLLLSLGAVPLAARLARNWGVLDRPGGRKLHDAPVPLAGGWALFAVFTGVIWTCLLGALALGDSPAVAAFLPDRARSLAGQAPLLALKFLPVWGGAAAMFLVGLADDVRGLRPRTRLLAQAAVGTGLAFAGLHPDLGFLPAPLPAAVGILWLVGVTNAFNLLDGLDGLSAGVALVGVGALLTIMGLANQPDWAFFLAVVGGSLLGFLRWNWHPARVFLGSAGSLLVGYLLAVSTMMITYQANLGNWLMPLLAPVCVVALPLYDTLGVILIRLLQRRGVLVADRSHVHHRLLRVGLRPRQAASFMILLAFSIALSGVRLVSATLAQSFVILVQILALVALLVLAELIAHGLRRKLLDRRERRADRVLESAPKP
jgi:UDP-GlcNAc:undecaprenyl-phosphate GlcNAc-1-phosphate transferase